jgi:hypothetical protein
LHSEPEPAQDIQSMQRLEFFRKFLKKSESFALRKPYHPYKTIKTMMFERKMKNVKKIRTK